jgi:hypothetical protein
MNSELLVDGKSGKSLDSSQRYSNFKKKNAEKAFTTWEKVINLSFKYSIINPDIAISEQVATFFFELILISSKHGPSLVVEKI